MKQVFATVCRTQMCGGGTSYDVYFRKQDKPSHPIHGSTYATTVILRTGEFFRVTDAIDPKERWSQEAGIKKYDSFKRLERVANRLAVRIAKRAFSELRGFRVLPLLWASWSLPSAETVVAVNLTLPE